VVSEYVRFSPAVASSWKERGEDTEDSQITENKLEVTNAEKERFPLPQGHECCKDLKSTNYFV